MSPQLKKYLGILEQYSDQLQKEYFVKQIGIFGSTVHGTQKKSSDIDVLVEFSEPVGFFKFIKLENFLKKIFKKKVDLATKGALKSLIKQDILKDVIYA